MHDLLGKNASNILAQDFLGPSAYLAHGVAVNHRGGFDVLLPVVPQEPEAA